MREVVEDMEFSSDSSASIEFHKRFYKQMFYDLYNELNSNVLVYRFYLFQVELFKSYSAE